MYVITYDSCEILLYLWNFLYLIQTCILSDFEQCLVINEQQLDDTFYSDVPIPKFCLIPRSILKKITDTDSIPDSYLM